MTKNNDYISAFEEHGIEGTIQNITSQIQKLYLSDNIPWVVGYSGGKDSTAVLQLVWNAIFALKKDQRHKNIYVISTDTLVENPVVSIWVENSLEKLGIAAKDQSLPILPNRLTPEVTDRYWVNLIGKGYPAPRDKFRWCTSRLKIFPSNKFITEIVSKNGEAILVLGIRKKESAARAKSMEKFEEGSTRDLLSRNQDLNRVWVYSPVSEWSNDDVWEYICSYENPWGYDNDQLLAMYRGATEGGECPLVVDTSTPSCGDSRFGCFVCTLVDKDKSMQAMIQNDNEKKWMMPLVKLRNKFLNTNDRDKRDFRRMNGSLLVHNERLVHGPYKQKYRETLLAEVLKAENEVRKNAPEQVKNIQLITLEELDEIRRIWVVDKHEIEDNLPKIYEKINKKLFPGSSLDERPVISSEDIEVLKNICDENGDDESIHFELVRELIDIEQSYKNKLKRSGIFDAIEKTFEKSSYSSSEEANSIKMDEILRKEKSISKARNNI